MKHLFKPNWIKTAIFLLGLLLVLKLLWFAVEVLFLPAQGIDQEKDNGGKSLYYRVKLTPNDAPAPQKTAPVRHVRSSSIKDIKLLAIYNASDDTVVVVSYKGKNKILAKGEEVGGYRLEGAARNYATFSKESKSYKVMLDTRNLPSGVRSHQAAGMSVSAGGTLGGDGRGEIVDAGDRKIIDRSLLEFYSRNLREIERNIGISESRNGGAMDGFKVNFIRKGSDFAKLGLKRNDVIKAVNGRPITNYKAAMDIYRKVGEMENMTLTIKRGNEEMELEYEVN